MRERIAEIEGYIKKNGEAKISELSTLFPDVSEMTIRRDIERLEKTGSIIRTKGGVKSIEYVSRLKEELYSKRAFESVEEKNEIARKARGLIKEGSTVFLDSGTTIAALARLLTDEKLFIVTAAPNIAIECAQNPNASVYMTGGYLNRDNLSLSGINAESFLENINIDVAFMAASGFSFKSMFTCGNFDECKMKRQAIKRAAKSVMLIDSGKLGRGMPFTFAEMGDLHCIVTDGNADKDFINLAKNNEIEVV